MSQSLTGSAENHNRIIVIVPNEPGGLAQVTAALGDANINIESIDGRLAGELGVITLTTSDDDAALHTLLEEGLRAVTSDSVLFHLPDQPGALAGVAQLFSSHRLNVRTIHIVHRLSGRSIVAVTTDDNSLARSLLDSDTLL